MSAAVSTTVTDLTWESPFSVLAAAGNICGGVGDRNQQREIAGIRLARDVRFKDRQIRNSDARHGEIEICNNVGQHVLIGEITPIGDRDCRRRNRVNVRMIVG